MLAISMRLAIALRALLQYAPTNLLLRRLRSRDGLKWVAPFMLLGVAYLLAAALLTHLLNDDGSGWLNMLVILGIWNGIKFIAFGPISVIFLARAWITEHRQRSSKPRRSWLSLQRSRLLCRSGTSGFVAASPGPAGRFHLDEVYLSERTLN